MTTTNDNLIDQIPMQGDTFMKGVFELRGLCHAEGHRYHFCDGVYLFDPFPNETGTDMALFADTEQRRAMFVTKEGQSYDLNTIDLRQTEAGEYYVGFQLGAMDLITDEQRALIKWIQPHMAKPLGMGEETVYDEFWKPPFPVKGAPNLSHPVPIAYVYREERISNAQDNLAALYPGHYGGGVNERTRNWAEALDDWSTAFLSTLSHGETSTTVALRNLYERHCQAMTEIRGITGKETFRLVHPGGPSLYCTAKGQVNYQHPYRLQSFQTYKGIEAIPTAMPGIWILRFPKHWWEARDSKARESKHTRWLYESGTRKFCDVHVPVRHRGGIDEFLFGPWNGLASSPGFLEGFDLSEWIRAHADYLSGEKWPYGEVYKPENLSRAAMNMRSGSRWPWLSGPVTVDRQWHGRAWPIGMRNRPYFERTGLPDISLDQGRNGLNNDKAIKAIRRMAQELMSDNSDFLEWYQPADHALACHYHLISRRSNEDVKRLLGMR